MSSTLSPIRIFPTTGIRQVRPPILYQSGYLTLTDYNEQYDEYTLGFPNEEVKYGFLKSLLPAYSPRPRDIQGVFVRNFVRDLYRGDTEGFMNRLKVFFAGIPYELNDRTERHYQMLMYVVFTLMGEFVQAELRSAAGRAVLVISTGTAVFDPQTRTLGDWIIA